MPKSPQMAPLDVEEQQLYSELLLDGCAPHPISKGNPGHPAGSRSFGHDPEFMPIGEDKNGTALSSPQWTGSPYCQGLHYCGVHTNLPVDLPLHFLLSNEQDPEILELLVPHLLKPFSLNVV
ncbi:hypothetical protein CHARACLAT_025586 [Characodon lateralis]|uniref:Uncharacterized protein n=1 Tax=Characodon lateralis TaxID=208331 RepID=A0ABU7CVD4_9TELE|nr:hypothetical protein [Characodon lateralis]